MLRKSTIFFTLFLLMLTVFSCSRTPSGVIKEKKMKHVIVDMKIAEAMIDFNSNIYRDSLTRDRLFQSVFKKHKITQAEYDSSLLWYGRNLEIYMSVFDQAVKEIDDYLALNKSDDVEVISAGMEDSVNMWPYKSRYTISSIDMSPLFVFTIKPKTYFDGETTFEFETQVWGMHSGIQSYPELYICLQQRDTMVYLTEPIRKNGTFRVSLEGSPSYPIQKIYGYIYKKPEPTFHKIYLDTISLIKYRTPKKEIPIVDEPLELLDVE